LRRKISWNGAAARNQLIRGVIGLLDWIIPFAALIGERVSKLRLVHLMHQLLNFLETHTTLNVHESGAANRSQRDLSGRCSRVVDERRTDGGPLPDSGWRRCHPPSRPARLSPANAGPFLGRSSRPGGCRNSVENWLPVLITLSSFSGRGISSKLAYLRILHASVTSGPPRYSCRSSRHSRQQRSSRGAISRRAIAEC